MTAPPEPDPPTTRVLLHAWLWWIAASAIGAAMPVILVVDSLFGVRFPGQALLLVTLPLAAGPVVLQGLVLRRLAGGRAFALWVVTSWSASLLAFTLRLESLPPDPALAFDPARIMAMGGSILSVRPWLAVALFAAAMALLYQLLPILVLGWETKRRWRGFLVATVTGACAAALLHKLYSAFVYVEPPSLWEPLRLYWSLPDALAGSLALAVFGMIQGAISGFGLVRMFAPADEAPADNGRFSTVMALWLFGLVAIVLVAAHLANAAWGPRGHWQSGSALQKLVVGAP